MIVGKYFDLILNSLVAGTPRKISGPRARDLLGLLEMQLALVCGGRDKRGGPTLTFPASTSREKARPEDYSRLLHYLTLVPRFVWKKAVSSFLRPQWWSAPGNSNRFEALLCPHLPCFKHKVSPSWHILTMPSFRWWRRWQLLISIGGDPLQMVHRGAGAEIQSNIWTNLIFSGTNMEKWRFVVNCRNSISDQRKYINVYLKVVCWLTRWSKKTSETWFGKSFKFLSI